MRAIQDTFCKDMQPAEADRLTCFKAVRRIYGEYHAKEYEYQGHCSYTWLLTLKRGEVEGDNDNQNNGLDPATKATEQLIIQVRPSRYALDLDVAYEANKIYPSFAPKVQALDVRLPEDLTAYEMSKVEGIPLSHLGPREISTEGDWEAKQRNLVTSFAKIIAQAWPEGGSRKRRDSVLRSESPINQDRSFLSLCTGKVGSRIVWKLDKLAQELPDKLLREKARITANRVQETDCYPVVLNHGDLIPSNILVDKETWEITGLVDWAEAEWMPFGTCLYGLEHLLGYLRLPSQDQDEPTFIYYDHAAQLRELFYDTLLECIPELRDRQKELLLMRDIGVFLWHGYAWDEGAIDRVVDGVNDGEELAKLRAFLSV